VLHFLLVAGANTERSCPVYVFIDEFQAMAAQSLDLIFQMTRSLNIHLIIANQNMGDLREAGPTLADAIEGTCDIRQWFSASSERDIAKVMALCGTKEELQVTVHHGQEKVTSSSVWVDKPRMSATDIHQVSDNPHLSILRISGVRSGYARFRGIPFVARSEFHISAKEYQRRLAFKWPIDLTGMIQNRDLAQQIIGPTLGNESNKPRRTPKRTRTSDQAWPQDLFVDEEANDHESE
jgi:hypothetical protein